MRIECTNPFWGVLGFVIGGTYSAINGAEMWQVVLSASVAGLFLWLILNGAEDKKTKTQIKEPDILSEIETLFDEIKEGDMLNSSFEEQREEIASNLIVAYYLAKLERRL